MADYPFPNPSQKGSFLADLLPELADRTGGAADIHAGWKQLHGSVQKQLGKLKTLLPNAAEQGRMDVVAAGLTYLHDVHQLEQRTTQLVQLYPLTHLQDMSRDPAARELETGLKADVKTLYSARTDVAKVLAGAMDEKRKTSLLDAHPELKSAEYLLDMEVLELPPPLNFGEAAPDALPHEKQTADAQKLLRETFEEIQNPAMPDEEVLARSAAALQARYLAEKSYRDAVGWPDAVDLYSGQEGIPPDLLRKLVDVNPLQQGLKGTMRAVADKSGLTIPAHPTLETMLSWEGSQTLVRDAFAEFHPAMGRMVERALSEGWVDAEMTPQKTGASSSSGLPQRSFKNGHPYVRMKFDGTIESTLVLAHELSHAMTQYSEMASAEERTRLGINELMPPSQPRDRLSATTMHETFAHIGEKIVGEHIVRRYAPTEHAKDAADQVDKHVHRQYGVRGWVKSELMLRDHVEQHGELSAKKLDKILNKGMGRYDTSHNMRIGGQLFNQTPLYNASYLVAETGARAFMQSLREATPEYRAEMQQRLVDAMGMGSANNGQWTNMMQRLGVDPTQPDFVSKAMKFDASPRKVDRMLSPSPIVPVGDVELPPPLPNSGIADGMVKKPELGEIDIRRFGEVADEIAARLRAKNPLKPEPNTPKSVSVQKPPPQNMPNPKRSDGPSLPDR